VRHFCIYNYFGFNIITNIKNRKEKMTKRNHYLLEITKWTMQELQSEVDGYKQLGGVGVKDIIRKNEAEDELNWRNEKGYYDLTPEEIQEEQDDK
jgi:hypothetical protein